MDDNESIKLANGQTPLTHEEVGVVFFLLLITIVSGLFGYWRGYTNAPVQYKFIREECEIIQPTPPWLSELFEEQKHLNSL